MCLPQGPLQYHLDPQPRKIVQTPGQILIIYESNYGLRTIYTDGRRLPPQGEPQPYWHGYSVGRWEGDTLVVESNNFHDDGWLDTRGSPYTDAARVTERFRRVNFGRLDIEFTLNDPKAHEALYAQSRAAGCGRRIGDDRVHLPREPAVVEARAG
jgi:hypothetical protein